MHVKQIDVLCITNQRRRDKKIELGFTLVELLIVIAILGVLAAVILVAINPLEQLGRGRDAGRISAVNQLAHAMNNYYTAAQLTQFPAASNTWQNSLLVSNSGSGDITNKLTVPGVSGYACPAGTGQGKICYQPYQVINPQDTFIIWTPSESNANQTIWQTKSGSAVACANTVVLAYDSYASRLGYSCVATGIAPTGGPSGTTNIYY